MKLNKIQKFLLSCIGAIVALSFALNVMQMTSTIPYSSEAYSLVNMLRYSLFEYPIRSVNESIDIISRTWSLEEENETLRQQVQGIASLQAKLVEQQQQINELQELNELKTILTEYEVYPATVLSRSYEGFDSHLTIDIGLEDGIEENYAVLSSKGLVGRVVEVSNNQSVVNLLTVADGSNKVSVKVVISDGVQADAILERYSHEEQAFVVKLLDSNNTVTEEMDVITSGMGGVFPSGLLVGEIKRVDELENAIGMDILVEPAAEFENLNYLYVVKRVDN